MSQKDFTESDMLMPVLRLYAKRRYRRFVEVPLGRKRIDVLCVPKSQELPQVSIELKISDWRKALWQATVNYQIADESYIAIWHDYVERALRRAELLRHYRVGLISVREKSARIVLPAYNRIHRLARRKKKDFYAALARAV